MKHADGKTYDFSITRSL